MLHVWSHVNNVLRTVDPNDSNETMLRDISIKELSRQAQLVTNHLQHSIHVDWKENLRNYRGCLLIAHVLVFKFPETNLDVQPTVCI